MDYQQQVYEVMVRLPIEYICVQFGYLSCFAVSQRRQRLRRMGGMMEQHYTGVVTALNDRMKKAPLDFLYSLACIPLNSRDPEEVADICLTVYEHARIEIHRRSFQNLLYKPNKKSSMNPMCMGYPRKLSH